MKYSIQGKIIIWIIVVILSIGALISVFITLRVETILFSSEKKTFHKTNIEDAKQIKSILDNTVLFTKMIATRTRVVEYLQTSTQVRKEELVVIFDEYQKSNSDYLSIYLMDATGSALISTDRSFLGSNYGFRPYFKEAMKGTSFVDVALGKTTNKLGYYFSHPVFSPSGRVLGVMAVKLEPISIYNALDDHDLTHESTVMITNLHGVVLFSTKNDRVLKSLGKLSSEYQRDLKNSNSFLGLFIQPLQYEQVQHSINTYSQPQTIEIMDSKDNERELLSIARISSYPFYLVTEVGLNSIIEQIVDIARLLGIGIFSAALLCLFVIAFVIRKVLKPLDSLKDHAQELGKGNFSKKLNLKTGDELESLGIVLNNMQDSMQELYTGLEEKVTLKTKELTSQLAETEQTKKAMLNLLEDLNKQKEKIEKHAVELQKFQLAVENAHDHIVITDPDGVILYANKAVEKITGYSSSEIFNRKAGGKQLWGGFMGQKTYELFWKQIKTEKKVFIGEFSNQRKNGQKYIAEAQVSPILDENGNVLFFVGIERDVTKAKEIDRMKTEFISLASHQLRTPLSAMKWFLEMLLHGDAGTLSPEQEEFVTNVEQSNNRMIELVNSLLNVSRIESGRIMIEPTPTDLKQLVDEVKKEVLVKLEEKQQRLIIDIHKSLPAIPLDQKLIRQVYINLLTNAIKYSPEKGDIYLFISKENDTIITQVSDNGYGIPVGEQDRIFAKFYRATNAVKKETEGNGLGLYLVKSIVESSGGKIWFTSIEGKGSSFFFSIPLKGMQQKDGEVSIS